jgi:uncharacterized protein YjcR
MTKQERAKVWYKGKDGKRGMALAAIGKRLGVSHVTVRNWLISQKVKLRKRGRPANV